MAAAAVVLIGTALTAVLLIKHRLPPGIMKDVRAGLPVRNLKDPDQRILGFMEARYGPMSDPAHRREAFIDFFNPDHIQALQLLAKHSPETNRQANIDAMARWVANYRTLMSTEERDSLKSQLQTPEGQAMLRRATAQYNAQDVRYRGNTAPVISQLLKTLNEVESNR
jgi:hypothetical protein